MASVTVEKWEARREEAREYLERAFSQFAAPELREAAARGVVRLVAVWAMGGPDPDTLSMGAINSYVMALVHPTRGATASLYHCGRCALLSAALSRAGLPIREGFDALLDHRQVEGLATAADADGLAGAVGKVLAMR